MIQLSFASIAGALMNRVRGGWLLPSGHKTANTLAFTALVGLLTFDLWQTAFAAAGMALGQAPGWGRYIGALGGWEKFRLEEVAAIDWLIQWAKPRMRLWGFCGLTLRGALWGLCLVPTAGSLWPVAGGMLMGVCYAATLYVWYRKGWEYGEVLFGAVLWGSVAVSL